MASNSLGTLTLDLIARIGGFEAGMDQAERKAKKSAKGISGAAKEAATSWSNVALAAAGAFAGFAVGATINAVIKNTREMEQEQAQLAAVLRSTGEAAGFSRTKLNEMATDLERVSTVSAGEINQAQTALLAFTGVVGDEFVRAQQAAVDMAARTGMAVTQTAETIGRALDVPSKGMAALSRQGFRFTDEQKEIIKHLEATGRAAEAQGIILGALEDSYGGAALAARDTFGGALLALQNTVNGLLTGSEGSLDSAKGAIEDLNTALSDPATAAAVGVLVDNLLSGAAAVVKALPFIIDAGDGVVRVFDIAANTLIGLYSTAAMYVQRLAASVLEAMALLPDSLGGAEFAARAAEYRSAAAGNLDIAQQAADGIRVALEKPLAGTAMAEAARQAAGLNREKKEGVALDEAAELAGARGAAAGEKARKAAEKAAEAAKKKAAANAAAIESEITALERAAKVWGMSADEVRIYDLRVKGATESQLEHAQALLETVSSLEKQKKAQEAIATLEKSLTASRGSESRQYVDELAGIGLSDKAQERLRSQRALIADYQDQINQAAQARAAGDIDDQVYEKQLDLYKDHLDQRLGMQQQYYSALDAMEGNWQAGASKGLQNYADQARDIYGQTADLVQGTMESLSSGVAESLTGAIMHGEDLRSSMEALSQTILEQVLGSLIEMGVQYGVNAALEIAGITAVSGAKVAASAVETTADLAKTATTTGAEVAAAGVVAGAEIAAIGATTAASAVATATTTATQTAAAATTTAAWTPAAIVSSIGSFGTAAAIGLAAVVAALAFTGGFRKGGYTGNGGVDDVAGVVHGKEFVFDADATSRIGVSNLEAIRAGRMNTTLERVSVDMAEQRGGRQLSRGGVTVNQNINTTGRIDNRTSNQIATDASRKARQASSRLG